MADKKNVAILGATGAVGTQMLQCLAERDFPVGELRLLASARSAGKKVEWCGRQIELVEATPEAFEGMDIVLGAAGDDVAKQLLPEAAPRCHRGGQQPPSASTRTCPRHSEAEDVSWNHGLIANPNCATIIGLVPTWPLHNSVTSDRVRLTYQAASGAGAPGMAELEAEICAMGRGEKLPDRSLLTSHEQLIPRLAPRSSRATPEEMKMQNDGQDHARARPARELHLRARAGAALAL